MSDYADPMSKDKDKMKPTCMIVVSKDAAQNMKVGSSVSLDVSGTVKALHPNYDDKDQYEVTIEDPMVEVEDESENESGEDDNMATMPLKKLKSKLPKNED